MDQLTTTCSLLIKDLIDKRTISTAVDVLLTTNLTMHVKQAMYIAGFTHEEATNLSIQQRVRRAYLKQRKTKDQELNAAAENVATAMQQLKKIRKSSKQVHQQRSVFANTQNTQDAAHIAATLMLEKENQKPLVERKSSRQVVAIINKEYGTNLSHVTICRYVREGKAGLPPARMGNPGKLSDTAFKLLAGAYESFVLIA